MQFKKVVMGLVSSAMMVGLCFGSVADAAPKGKVKKYDEVSFLKTFSGKTRKQVADTLGEPLKKELSVKPSNAENVISRPLDTSKAGNVEMWYYSNIVKYDDTHTYKSTEFTFVNDRCQSIAFFNNK